jgi:hypothetical protein
MCHYAQLTFPVPAVIVVTLYPVIDAVEPVNPAPIGYFNTTIPEPPFAPVLLP